MSRGTLNVQESGTGTGKELPPAHITIQPMFMLDTQVISATGSHDVSLTNRPIGSTGNTRSSGGSCKAEHLVPPIGFPVSCVPSLTLLLLTSSINNNRGCQHAPKSRILAVAAIKFESVSSRVSATELYAAKFPQSRPTRSSRGRVYTKLGSAELRYGFYFERGHDEFRRRGIKCRRCELAAVEQLRR